MVNAVTVYNHFVVGKLLTVYKTFIRWTISPNLMWNCVIRRINYLLDMLTKDGTRRKITRLYPTHTNKFNRELWRLTRRKHYHTHCLPPSEWPAHPWRAQYKLEGVTWYTDGRTDQWMNGEEGKTYFFWVRQRDIYVISWSFRLRWRIVWIKRVIYKYLLD